MKAVEIYNMILNQKTPFDGLLKMKPNELRIGNYVNRVHSSIGEKTGIICFDERIWYAIGESLDYLQDYEPIPLTEEWLVKFGFVKDEHFEHWKSLLLPEIKIVDFPNTGIQNKISIFGNSIRLCSKHLGKNWREESFSFFNIKYVHQLQNLYFALTGEELTYTNNG